MNTANTTPSAKMGSNHGTVYLLRHGAIQSPGEGKRYIGWQDQALNDAGRRQALFWADYFSSLPLDGIYCSDLQDITIQCY